MAREWTDWAPLGAQVTPTGHQPVPVDAFALLALAELASLIGNGEA